MIIASLETLAEKTRYGINAVKRARAFLIDVGLLIPVEQTRRGGQFGLEKFRVTAVSKQCDGTSAVVPKESSTVAPKQCVTVVPKQCQEGFPVEGTPIRSSGEAAATVSDSILEGEGSPTPEEKSCQLECGAWKAVGIEGHGPQRYRDGWVKAYHQHREKAPSAKLSDVMEQFIRECENQKIKIPPTFYTARRAIEVAENRQGSIPAAGSEGKGKFDDIPIY